MSVFNSVGTSLVVFLVIVMIGGAIFGVSIAGADSLNPAASQAEANRISIDASHAQAVYEQEERILKAETEMQISKLNIDSSAYQEQVAQNLAHQKEMQLLESHSYQRMAAAKEQFMIIVGYGLSFAIVLAAILLAAGRILQVIRSTKPQSPEKIQEKSPTANDISDPLNVWRLPQYRHQMIMQARENEKAHLQAIKDSKVNSSSHSQTATKDGYQNLPLAE
jgi:hypothetical protein